YLYVREQPHFGDVCRRARRPGGRAHVLAGPFVDRGLVGLAFAAGLVAALNPCGFAMLPAYLVLVVRGEGARGPEAGAGISIGLASVGRALAATGGMGLGFLTVFGLFGALTLSAAATVQRYVPYLTMVVGIVLVALGIWLLLGRELMLLTPK